MRKISGGVKKLLYSLVIIFHFISFSFFIFVTYYNLALTIFGILAIAIVYFLAFYLILKEKQDFFYSLIGIIVISIPVNFVVPLLLIINIPEVLLLFFLAFKSPTQVEILNKSRSSNRVGKIYHDPAVISSRYSPNAANFSFKLNDKWNPNGTTYNNISNNSKKKEKPNWKLQLVISILSFFILSYLIVSIYDYFDIY
ncbi:MAG: hypothetical protein GF311_23045 [Candidatus Lokiarchaeota archaeon]|nr:hypothetical protein [Candidatus Lokiarchaeota archaeon]